jgi:hypothetical protein
MKNDYKISDALMNMLMDKYGVIMLRIGQPSQKQEAMFFDGIYYRMWFDPTHEKEGGLIGSVYMVEPKYGNAKGTTYRAKVYNDDDVEKMFQSISPEPSRSCLILKKI